MKRFLARTFHLLLLVGVLLGIAAAVNMIWRQNSALYWYEVMGSSSDISEIKGAIGKIADPPRWSTYLQGLIFKISPGMTILGALPLGIAGVRAISRKTPGRDMKTRLYVTFFIAGIICVIAATTIYTRTWVRHYQYWTEQAAIAMDDDSAEPPRSSEELQEAQDMIYTCTREKTRDSYMLLFAYLLTGVSGVYLTRNLRNASISVPAP